MTDNDIFRMGEIAGNLSRRLADAERQRDELTKVCADAIQFVIAWAEGHRNDSGEPSAIGMRVVLMMREAIRYAKGGSQ